MWGQAGSASNFSADWRDLLLLVDFCAKLKITTSSSFWNPSTLMRVLQMDHCYTNLFITTSTFYGQFVVAIHAFSFLSFDQWTVVQNQTILLLKIAADSTISRAKPRVSFRNNIRVERVHKNKIYEWIDKWGRKLRSKSSVWYNSVRVFRSDEDPRVWSIRRLQHRRYCSA
jgi:hypothetical protein